MAVRTCHGMVNQPMLSKKSWDQVMDHFLRVCKLRICMILMPVFMKFIFTACFG